MSPFSQASATPPATTRASARRVLPYRHPRPGSRAESLQPGDLGLGELFLHTRDAVVVGNVETGTIALWNPAAERLFGYTPQEAIGRPIDMLLPPAIARLHNEALVHYRRRGFGALVGSGAPIEVPALTKTGEEVRVELTLVALTHASVHGRFVLAMLRDIAIRRRAEIQALESARALAARAEADTALYRMRDLLRHGLRDLERPVARLQRTAATLARVAADADKPANERVSRLARLVELRTAAVRQMAVQLADRAAIETGDLQCAPERVNLVPLLARVVAAARARGTGHRLTLAMPQGLTVSVDPKRIEQVLTEMIDLAVRRSPRGAWIDIDLRRPLIRLARLEVRDYGKPVQLQLREQLLDKASHEPSLFVCRVVLEHHGGTLTAEHPAEGGLRLVATLPAQRGRVGTDG